MPFVDLLWDHCTQAALLLWMTMGLSVYCSKTSRSFRMFEICWNVFVHSSTEPILALQELRVV